MTYTEADLAVLERLYAALGESLRRGIPGIADGLQTQLLELYAHPSECAAEMVACNLEGARQTVLRYADALRQENEPWWGRS